ncbi:hypothetical protein [Streptomyces sp. NPDC048665]|uniref:hypothetical protein n=1 Tax=Streptomyces sp. NPDC048665 TaxID=3155490 RepID=UPI0034414434
MTDSRGKVISCKYDEVGRKTAEQRPALGPQTLCRGLSGDRHNHDPLCLSALAPPGHVQRRGRLLALPYGVHTPAPQREPSAHKGQAVVHPPAPRHRAHHPRRRRTRHRRQHGPRHCTREWWPPLIMRRHLRHTPSHAR